MRTARKLQLFLRFNKPETKVAAELDEMSKILENLPERNEIYQEVLKNLSGGKKSTGAEGMSAEQIIRLGILRIKKGLTYRELSEQTADSISVREFLNLGNGKSLSRSGIQSNLKRVPERIWILLNESLKKYAVKIGMEDGRVVRGDTTTTETNIHYPTDAGLMVDSIRVLTRAMNRAKYFLGVDIKSSDHYCGAKKKLYKINNSKKARKKQDAYLELIRLTRSTIEYAEAAVPVLAAHICSSVEDIGMLGLLEANLRRYIPLSKQVLDQGYRRIVKKEKVPSSEKIVSIFEPETDIIEKGQREVVFGHKVLISTGKSSMILNLSVLDGNPSDKTLVEPVLIQHRDSYGTAPEQLAFDGGFASFKNRDLAKSRNVKEITFSKNLNMPLDSLVSNGKMHKLLMRFRAGVEGCISFMKRCFGLSRILDRGKETFHSVAQCAAVACNLTLLARFHLQKLKS